MKTNIDQLKKLFNLEIEHISPLINYPSPIPVGIKKSYHGALYSINAIESVVLTPLGDTNSLQKHYELFQTAFNKPVIFHITTLTSSLQKYLLDHHISFISKNSVYLPHMLSYFKHPLTQTTVSKKNKKLSKLAQMILLYSLANKCHELDIHYCMKKFGVTNMSIGRALNELVEFQFFTVKESGRKKLFYITSDIKLNDILKALKTPKYEEVYINTNDLKYFKHMVKSSYMALATYADFGSNEQCYAIEKEYFLEVVDQNQNIKSYENSYGNDLIKIELWRYAPEMIKPDTIDPISLYMMLKDEINEDDTREINALIQLREILEGS